MNIDKEQLALLIDVVMDEFNFSEPSIFEKDYYVTQVIHSLAHVKNRYFSLVFAGGTSLAKAHRLVMRMSEDCDFRIQSTSEAENLNSSQRHHELKVFRQEMLHMLTMTGFRVDEESMRVRDKGHYMSAFLPYESAYPASEELRPDIKIEFMAINTKLAPVPKPVTTLIRNLLGDRAPHTEKAIDTIDVIETAVDKWVALTRRIASTLRRDARQGDHDLVRHIYDLYYIAKHGHMSEAHYPMIAKVIGEDLTRYKNHNSAYYDNPVAEINLALEALQKKDVWRERWDRFTDNMVLSTTKLSYHDAVTSLLEHSEPILTYLSKAPMKAAESLRAVSQQVRQDKTFWQQEAITQELQLLEGQENPHLKRLSKLHKVGCEQGFTPDILKGLTNAMTQITNNRVVLRVLENAAPVLFDKAKAMHVLQEQHGISH